MFDKTLPVEVTVLSMIACSNYFFFLYDNTIVHSAKEVLLHVKHLPFHHWYLDQFRLVSNILFNQQLLKYSLHVSYQCQSVTHWYIDTDKTPTKKTKKKRVHISHFTSRDLWQLIIPLDYAMKMFGIFLQFRWFVIIMDWNGNWKVNHRLKMIMWLKHAK